jgi:amino acid permease
MSLLRDLQTFFVTIATILGTGILALPVKLAKCGFFPFLLAFSVCLFMQLSTVLLMVELLQRTKLRMVVDQRLRKAALEESGYGTSEDEAFPAPDDAHEHEAIADLHTMGKTFLGPFNQKLFDAAVMLHFVSVLISYGLAGALSYSQLLGVHVSYMIAPVTIVYSLIVILASGVIKPIISTFTVAKCIVLVLIIAVVGVVSSVVGEVPHDGWSATLESFLIGTVALGGIVNVMPVLFAGVPFEAQAISRFRIAVVSGVAVCWLLNVLWAAFILHIVPQTEYDAIHDVAHPQLANLGVSLEQAEVAGEIATIPTVAIIKAVTPQFFWVALTVSVFILLSVSVSYLTVGTGLKHVLDGMARQWSLHNLSSTGDVKGIEPDSRGCRAWCVRTLPWLWTESGTRWFYYLFWFGLVLAVALVNPQGFLIVLEVFTSFALNVESGFLIGVMFYEASVAPSYRISTLLTTAASSADQGVSFAIKSVCTDVCYGWGRSGSRDARSGRALRETDASSLARARSQEFLRVVEDSPASMRRAEAAEAPTPPAVARHDWEDIPLPLGKGPGSLMLLFVVVTFLFAVLYDVVDASRKYLGWDRTLWLILTFVAALWSLSLRRAFFPANYAWHTALPSPSLSPPLSSLLTCSVPRGHKFSRQDAEALPIVATDSMSEIRPRAPTARTSTADALWGRVWAVATSSICRSALFPALILLLHGAGVTVSGDASWANSLVAVARGLFILSLLLRVASDSVQTCSRALRTSVLLLGGAWVTGLLFVVVLFADNAFVAGGIALPGTLVGLVELQVRHAVWSFHEADSLGGLYAAEEPALPPSSDVLVEPDSPAQAELTVLEE